MILKPSLYSGFHRSFISNFWSSFCFLLSRLSSLYLLARSLWALKCLSALVELNSTASWKRVKGFFHLFSVIWRAKRCRPHKMGNYLEKKFSFYLRRRGRWRQREKNHNITLISPLTLTRWSLIAESQNWSPTIADLITFRAREKERKLTLTREGCSTWDRTERRPSQKQINIVLLLHSNSILTVFPAMRFRKAGRKSCIILKRNTSR